MRKFFVTLSKETGIEIKRYTTECLHFVIKRQGAYENMAASKSIENIIELKYFGTTLRIKIQYNCFLENYSAFCYINLAFI
jgi:hypothetical protein